MKSWHTRTTSSTTGLAEQKFRCLRPSGEAFFLTIRIGEPVSTEISEQGPTYSRCRIGLEPLALERWGAGNNAFQAICLSLDYVRTVFKIFIAEGGRVYWEDTDSHIDISSPWCAPLPSYSEISGQFAKQ